MAGVCRGGPVVDDIKAVGDHGISTFECLDGEMIMVDCDVFQIKLGGLDRKASDEAVVSFCQATTFSPSQSTTITSTSINDIADTLHMLKRRD